MPRMVRAVVPGVAHHVTQRGNRRQRTFCGRGQGTRTTFRGKVVRVPDHFTAANPYFLNTAAPLGPCSQARNASAWGLAVMAAPG